MNLRADDHADDAIKETSHSRSLEVKNAAEIDIREVISVINSVTHDT